MYVPIYIYLFSHLLSFKRNYTDKYYGACRNGRCDDAAVDQFSRGPVESNMEFAFTDETVLPATEMI